MGKTVRKACYIWVGGGSIFSQRKGEFFKQNDEKRGNEKSKKHDSNNPPPTPSHFQGRRFSKAISI